jgi:hypothetical protein
LAKLVEEDPQLLTEIVNNPNLVDEIKNDPSLIYRIKEESTINTSTDTNISTDPTAGIDSTTTSNVNGDTSGSTTVTTTNDNGASATNTTPTTDTQLDSKDIENLASDPVVTDQIKEAIDASGNLDTTKISQDLLDKFTDSTGAVDYEKLKELVQDVQQGDTAALTSNQTVTDALKDAIDPSGQLDYTKIDQDVLD